MPRKRGTLYTLFFAAVVCVFCAVLVSVSAVTLKPRQIANKSTDKQKNVLLAGGLISPEDTLRGPEIAQMFERRVHPIVVARSNGRVLTAEDALGYDQRAAMGDPAESDAAPPNKAKVARLPKKLLVYQVQSGSALEMVILPVQGKGLWSTLYGFLALDGGDPRVIRGIAFYEQGETPGLGGEVDNPKWRALWPGRRALDKNLEPVFSLKKGGAGSAKEDPYHVDALTGATMTSNGVTALVQFWLGPNGYGPYLNRLVERSGK